MSCADSHCPFLNRNDRRCAERFQVTHLQHAFRHCFDHYQACPTYLEMLVERRIKHIEAAHAHPHPNKPATAKLAAEFSGQTVALTVSRRPAA